MPATREPPLKKACREAAACSGRVRNLGTVSSLALSLLKAIFGILGGSEALAADGLHSLYQAWLCANSGPSAKKSGEGRWKLASRGAGVILVLGAADVLIFSVVHLVSSARGLLAAPSPLVLLIAVVSIVTNHALLTYSECAASKRGQGAVGELCASFRRSVVFSSVALAGVVLSLLGWSGGDPLAAIILGLLLIKPIKRIFAAEKTPGLGKVYVEPIRT